MQYDAVLFDMDGVLLTGRGTQTDVYLEATRRTFREFGVEEFTDDQVRAFTDPDFEDLGALCADYGLSLGSFWRRREDHATDLAKQQVGTAARRAFDDAAVVRDLPAELALGVVSNNRQATVEFVLESIGLRPAFEVVLGRDPTVEGYRRRKPNPAYLRRALDELDADAAVYVGDRATDVQAAAGAGIDSVLLDRPEHDPPAACDPTYTIPSLRDLPDCLE